MQPLRININRESSGCYYELDPISRGRVRAASADAEVAPMVFVGYGNRVEFEAVHRPLWPHIAQALTGLSWAQLEDLGGVVLYDPINEEEVLRVRPDQAA